MTVDATPLPVTAAILRDPHGRVLLAQRLPGKQHAGLWEFPGGKLEPGETPESGLARELHEELGIDIAADTPARHLITVPWSLGTRPLRLIALEVHAWHGEPHGREGQAICWRPIDTIDPASMPPADRPILAALRLPWRYAITSEPEPDREAFLAAAVRCAGQGGWLQLRAKRLARAEFETLARSLARLLPGPPVPPVPPVGAAHGRDPSFHENPAPPDTRRPRAGLGGLDRGHGPLLQETKAGRLEIGEPQETKASRQEIGNSQETGARRAADSPTRILLGAGAITLARDLGLGVHLDSATLMRTTARPLSAHQPVSAACHTLAELRHAESIGVDAALLGPVATTATHPDADPIGWHAFESLRAQVSIPVYALGGLGPADLATARHHGAQGIAAIRAFWPQATPSNPPTPQ